MTKDEELKQALKKAFQLGQDYWYHADHEFSSFHKKADAIREKFDQLVEETIKQALEQPEPEPVGWIERIASGVSYDLYHEVARKLPEGFRSELYTSPPKREPLTDEQIMDACDDTNWIMPVGLATDIARAIEAAHGIKGEDHG